MSLANPDFVAAPNFFAEALAHAAKAKIGNDFFTLSWKRNGKGS